MTDTRVDRYVADGAAWLDGQLPGWEDRVNLDRLFMWSPSHCVAGQVFGRVLGYRHVVRTLGWPGTPEHGFCASDDGLSSDLDVAWRKLIVARRVAKANNITNGMIKEDA
jgi:hypothetical protein